ncbi:MAG: hypothetical protein JSV85_07875 [Candidatus Bathyarchaeota archaeon]|nr:MAG: hypothetical protein JSV85_07875 [Candidatus Bathyarchaeota archaeon]
MKYSLVPQVYTIMAFGVSILLMPFMNGIAINWSTEGAPLFLIHPLFTLEYSLILSTAIAWFIASLFSLRNVRKQAMGLVEAVEHNWLLVSLVLLTLVVALSGCMGFSEAISFKGFCARASPASGGLLTHNLFTHLRIVNATGMIGLEPLWITKVLSKYLRLHGTPRSTQVDG